MSHAGHRRAPRAAVVGRAAAAIATGRHAGRPGESGARLLVATQTSLDHALDEPIATSAALEVEVRRRRRVGQHLRAASATHSNEDVLSVQPRDEARVDRADPARAHDAAAGPPRSTSGRVVDGDRRVTPGRRDRVLAGGDDVGRDARRARGRRRPDRRQEERRLVVGGSRGRREAPRPERGGVPERAPWPVAAVLPVAG